MAIRILGIESSCDDTSAGVSVDGQVLSNIIHSQDAHKLYGGVVPEVASRAHQSSIVPVVEAALREAGVRPQELTAVAYTAGPGLMGSLLVGSSFAKAYAWALGIPSLAVHHMHAHILSLFSGDPRPDFPFLCLTVSGGHTQLVVARSLTDLEVIGTTLDDAAGEAFDKTGKLLGLPYPAGPQIDALAREGEPRFTFPEPRIPGLDFSFSGLKTSILYFLQKEMQQDPRFIEKHLADICASVQSRIVSILLHKVEAALEQTGIRTLGVAGGVSANSGLREGLRKLSEAKRLNLILPGLRFCMDNGGMIALTGHFLHEAGYRSGLDLSPQARMPVIGVVRG